MPHQKPDISPTDPDFVDRVFEYLCAEVPGVTMHQLERARRALREEFAGETIYIANHGQTHRRALARKILALFNGRNASEVARHLGIGRTTVYRYLKQASDQHRAAMPADRPIFSGNGTRRALRSLGTTAPVARTSHQLEPAQWPLQPTTSTPSTPPSPAASSPSATTAAPSPTAASQT